MMRIVRLLAALVFAGSAFTPLTSASAQALPPTLTGESLLSPSPSGPSSLQGSANCMSFGTSTISFTASGVAAGPYPGTFSESGSATIATLGFTGEGAVTSFNATFTIQSPAGTVTGTKSLAPPSNLAGNTGICITGGQASFGVTATYQAQIDTGGQTYADNGITSVAVNQIALGNAGGSFDENFFSNLQQVIPLCIEDEQGNQNQDDNGQGCANP